MVVPGLAVRRYAEEPCERLRQAGYDVDFATTRGIVHVPQPGVGHRDVEWQAELGT